MSLTAEQAERVRYLVEDEWVGDDPRGSNWAEFDRVLAQMSAEELHAFADQMNWDGGGSDRLNRVLAHPACDRGTALLIYWRADPTFYLKYGSRERVQNELWPDALKDFDMLRSIEAQFALGTFASARMPFDPRNDGGRDLTSKPVRPQPLPVYEIRNGRRVRVNPNAPPGELIDVRAALPGVMFAPVPS